MDDFTERAEHLRSIGLQPGWNAGLYKCQVCGAWHDEGHYCSMEICQCGRGAYDKTDPKRTSCYFCYLDHAVECIWCGRPHNPKYPICYRCQAGAGAAERIEAGKLLRTDVLIRDEARCAHCGQQNPTMQVDHIKPCRHGGTAGPWNLQVLCNNCNQIKSSRWWSGIFWEKKLLHWMHVYFTYGWGLLDNDQRIQLIAEASKYPGEFDWHSHYQRQPDVAQWAIDEADVVMEV